MDTPIEDLAVPSEQPAHYVCTGGCGFVAQTSGKCWSSGCPRARNPLNECRCQDGKHGDLPNLNARGISR